MASRNFLRSVSPRTDGEDPARRPPDPAAAAEDALLMLADIIEDLLDETSGGCRPASGNDGAH